MAPQHLHNLDDTAWMAHADSNPLSPFGLRMALKLPANSAVAITRHPQDCSVWRLNNRHKPEARRIVNASVVLLLGG
jgi:hypothetical protein